MNKRKRMLHFEVQRKRGQRADYGAFLVFIAFTNMRTKAKEAELDSKELLKQTLGLFVHDEK